ncbi:putative phage tail protein [Corallococcus coralloides DSM 2259]|uniref:Putative phage tail protein n=1 Tax=Corallococcus coralloides (strain ATCC 25202 / DSM 2259 / NBRC 100086 / M2) TaxID=1144275 RepID=H8MX62_CORCM|nr:phage tail protein [Corallococcus coralloides]AFE04870.1 putative phage tail protein [Corallococcus coralloides DSM 2259]
MDANGSRFHLLLGRDDWGRCTHVTGRSLSEAWADASGTGADVAWDALRAEVSLRAELFRFIAAPRDVAPKLEDRRGAARDRYKSFYWIDRDGLTVKVLSSGSRLTSTFWPAAPSEAREPVPGGFGPTVAPPTPAEVPLGGLGITSHHYLLVGTLAPEPGLRVFDLHSGGPPVRHPWPASVPFAPWDIAATPDGGAVVLDRTNRRLWRLDAELRVVRLGGETVLAEEVVESFQPADGGPQRRVPAITFPQPVSLDASLPLDAADPISVEVLPDGRVLVLDRGDASCFLGVYRDGQPEGAPLPLKVEGILQGAGPEQDFVLVPHDMALVPGTKDRPHRVLVVGRDGNQAFPFDLHVGAGGVLSAVPQSKYLPMRLFGGKALIGAGDCAFYDFADTFVPLKGQRRPRYVRDATLRTPVFDGRAPDCVWHRLMLDASIPPGARVTVRTRAANELADLEAAPFIEEPTLYKRGGGSELPYVAGAIGEHRGTFEVLFQRARGRYAQLELTLHGGGATTPRLHALRAWYPRFSYLSQYLPGVYRQDVESASFLDRFLANVEGLFTSIEDRIAAAQVLFDARSAPPEALDWLASWFAVAMDPAWDDKRRRLFLRHTLDFFQWRGTPRGLIMALRVALDEYPDDTLFTQEKEPTHARYRIVERFRSARTPFIAPPQPPVAHGIHAVAAATSRRWEPSQGRAQLLDRYRAGLDAAGVTATVESFPLREPAEAAVSAVWRSFCMEALGFIPAAAAADTPVWRAFLMRRYRGITALNLAHVTRLEDFTQASLPLRLPDDGPAQADWYHFETVVLPVRAASHRFTVVLPVPKGSAAEEQRTRLEQAMRVVAVEKPAHTVFDVKFYWAMFRVGEARLGVDTQIDLGSRAPELMPAMQLGREYLAESHLTPSPPQDARDRHILGRDALGRRESHGSDTP